MPAKEKMEMKGGMCSCQHHHWFAWIILVVGILYLLQDLSVITWFGWLNWWTAFFILFGAKALCRCCHHSRM